MRSFRDYLGRAEDETGIPLYLSRYDAWGADVQAYAEEIWPEMAALALRFVASELINPILFASPIEAKLYLALRRRFEWYFRNYPGSTVLMVNEKLSAISRYLEDRGQPAVHSPGEVDYEIDLFLYLDCFLVEHRSGRHIRYPFFIGIECDGHDFHERTPAQAEKDRSKDRRLKHKGLDVLRFTGGEITRSPDDCADEIQALIDAEYARLKAAFDLV